VGPPTKPLSNTPAEANKGLSAGQIDSPEEIVSSSRSDRIRKTAPSKDLLPAHGIDLRRVRTATAIIAAGAAAATCLGGASAAAATSGTPSLQVSAAANRISPNSLHGQTLSGSQYIFVTAPRSADVGSVYFYLDGKQVSHEKSAPFDLEGGTASRANALQIANLAAGKHTVKATVKMSHETLSLTGTFLSGTQATSTSTTAVLEVSVHADRTTPTTLHGQTLSGSQYVFVDAGRDKVSSVTFTLDGKQTALERKAPYDMYGGTTTAAVPLDADALAAGTHTVTATVKTSTTTRKLSGSFVAAGVASADPPATAPSPAPTSTPTPTPTPTPSEPTSTTSTFDPDAFDWTSVGDPSQATAGSVTLSTNGAVLSNCNIGTLHADAAGLVVKNCTVNGGIFGAGSYTLDHNFITSGADGIDPTGDGYKVIQYNKIWRDGTRVADKHQDGIQFWRGGNALISRNWISGFQTSAIMVKADQATISNVTIDSNYLNNPTGYYQLYLCPDSHSLRNITVTNNAFGKATSTISTCGSKLTFVHTEAQRSDPSWIVWDGNYVAGTHALVAPPGGWAQ
jgi:hypothetical protein